MISRNEREKIALELEKQIDKLLQGSYFEITNTPQKGKPFLIKELFGSKNGIMTKLAKLKGMGSSKFDKMCKKFNDERKKFVSTKDANKHFFGSLAELGVLSTEDATIIKALENRLKKVRKKAKDLGKSFDYKYLAYKYRDYKYRAGGIVVGVIVGSALVIGAGAAVGTGFGLLMLLTEGTAAVCLASILGCASLGAFASLHAVFPGLAAGLGAGTLVEDLYSEKARARVKKEDVGEFPGEIYKGVSPKLLFAKSKDGKIGILVSTRSIIFEPQDKIKNFYTEYSNLIKTFNKMCKDSSIQKFLPNNNQNVAEMRKILKYIKDYTEFINLMRSESENYLNSKKKSVGLKESEDIPSISDSKKRSYFKKIRPEDIVKMKFAKLCASLEYNEKKCIENSQKYAQQARIEIQGQEMTEVNEFLDNVGRSRNILLPTKIRCIPIEGSEGRFVECKPKDFEVITPNLAIL